MADWPTIASLATAGGTLVGVIYLAAAVRNAGHGVAVLHAWYCFAGWRTGVENRPHRRKTFAARHATSLSHQVTSASARARFETQDGYLFSLARQWNLDQPNPR